MIISIKEGSIMKHRSPLFLYCCIISYLIIVPVNIQAQQKKASIELSVDATETPRKILHIHETIAVEPGAVTLFYPKWIPGEHGPTGPVIDVAGLTIDAGKETISWRRDLEEMFAIHCDVPAGVKSIDVTFDFILPPPSARFSSGASSSAKLLVLSWNQVVVYPLSVNPHNISVSSSLRLPEGWDYATALTTKKVSDGFIHFDPVSLSMLIDSPVQAGAYLRKIDISESSAVPHHLDIVSDNEAALQISPSELAEYKNLVVQANALFGAHHYDHYDFLFTLSDEVAHFGLEHHQSSDDRVGERTLIDKDLFVARASLLPHEFVHSWNGKYRRPAGLATGDFSTPMKDDLLWVYEGLTEYLGDVLTARSGLYTPEEYREHLAFTTAGLDNRPGRTWRPLQDANDEAQLLYDARGDWDSWRRATDFYDEGELIWLEADATIRNLTKGTKSLDDFCKAFHGGKSSAPELKPYTVDDVVKTLDGVAHYDWKKFFTARLNSLDPHAPMGGIEASGWKLVYRDTMNGIQKAIEKSKANIDLRFSLGLLLGKNGEIQDVIPGTPAAKTGLAPGMIVVAVNGRKFSEDIIHDDVKLAQRRTDPLEFLVANGSFYRTYSVDYHGGERYPYLERDQSKPDMLSSIISAVGAK
jgi:predicted metalloprotease with PDZ domain